MNRRRHHRPVVTRCHLKRQSARSSRSSPSCRRSHRCCAGGACDRSATPDAEGASRARSPTEAFPDCRPETLPEMARRSRVNDELPIPFDGRGRMEVDLLCADARVVVELDGPQHLDVDAYRRDRRKDTLLQENGYFVLRFLAEDVGKRLNEVLDTVLRALAHRRGRQT